jgi:hypothetical protein
MDEVDSLHDAAEMTDRSVVEGCLECAQRTRCMFLRSVEVSLVINLPLDAGDTYFGATDNSDVSTCLRQQHQQRDHLLMSLKSLSGI